jgi:transcriptional regulator with XRE-family HTH domain
MSEINKEIGKKINTFRKMKRLTLEDLSAIICKSKSTISKYEKGEIAIDIETLYEISSALQIHVEQLLYVSTKRTAITSPSSCPAFFNGLSQFYSYLFDGRSNRIMDLSRKVQSTNSKYFKLSSYNIC